VADVSLKIPGPAFNKLVKIAGLLTSDQDGERSAAALMASNILRTHKVSWAELLTRGVVILHEAPPRPEPQPPPESPRSPWDEPAWKDAARKARTKYGDLLTEWERGFLSSILERSHLSDKQMATLVRIATKIKAATR
jgi:hypothetical protein